MDGEQLGAETVHRQGATGDLTIRAKDTFNIVPRRHHLSWCSFRATKGRNTSKLGHMVMTWKHQSGLFIYFWMNLLLEETD